MRTIDNLIHYSQGIIVVLLFLIGSITEVVMPVLVTLCLCLFLSLMALLFFTCAKKKYLKNRESESLKLVPVKNNDFDAA